MADHAMQSRLADAAVMPRKEMIDLSWGLCLFDFFVIVLGFVAGIAIYQGSSSVNEEELFRYGSVGTLFAIIFFICNDYRELYQREAVLDITRQMRGVALSWALTWGFLAFTGFALKASADLSRVVTFALAIIELPVLIAGRVAVRAIASSLSESREIVQSRIALLCIGDIGKTTSTLSQGYEIAYRRFVPADSDEQQLGNSIRAFLADLRGSDVGAIFVASSFRTLSVFHGLEALFRVSPLPVVLLTDDWISRAFSRPIPLGESHVGFTFQTPPLSLVEKTVKHWIDIILAGCAIVLASPIMLLVALAIKVDSRGPVIFRQRRQGFNGEEFNIFKFRSMTVLEDGAQVRQAEKSDRRVTRVGRFLRATSLDEIPQLFNVLRGEMSLVGPRPHAISHDDYYERLIRDYALRRHMRPGLTGWAQVNGHRGETPRVSDMEARVEHDIWYINNWSLTLDVWILLRTAAALLANKNVY